MKVFCRRNNGYQWTELPEGCFKGYLQLPGNLKPLRGEDALQCLSQAASFESFQELLKGLDGLYAVILRREDGTVWAAVDAARSIPLYYSADGRFLSDSGPAVREALGIPREAADPASLEELFYSSYIAGPRTVFSEIAQLDAGQALECLPTGEIHAVFYYAHIRPTKDIGREEALDLFQGVSDEAFDQIAAAIAGRPVALSLSGGYDSRYVACMLKRRGVEDVSCYTYGRADSFEVRQSEKIARALGYRWACVEYTSELVSGLLQDSVAEEYFQKFGAYDYAPVAIQNFPAVRYLHETGWFKSGSVFLTGLRNDVPTGCNTRYCEGLPPSQLSEETFAKVIAKSGSGIVEPWFSRLSEDARKKYLNTLAQQRLDLKLSWNSLQEFSNAAECLEMIRSHSRTFIHMNDIHEFFGYEGMLPCENRKLIDFWCSMPMKYKLHQNLFEEWIMTRVPAQYGVGQKKMLVGYTTFQDWERIKARAQLILKRTICLPFGIPQREKQDINNFEPLATELFRKLHQKKRIGFRNADWVAILSLYMMERCYGPNCLKK